MNTISAFVTGADHPTALGAARGLRSAGARVIGFSSRPKHWACRSRAWDEVRELKSADPMGRVEEVYRAAASIDGPVFLLPTEDNMVRHFSECRPTLPENVRIALPDHDTVELLLEKTRFFVWARERGYPLPESVVVESRSELESALRSLRLPAVLKPLVRTAGWQRESPVMKAVRLTRPEDLETVAFDLFEAAPSFVLSEWIEGEDSDVFFCLVFLDEHSEVVAGHSGRKLLQYPRLTGSTAVCVDHPHPELEELTAALFREVGCRGLASLEVKRHTVDGRILITEPTVGRPNLQSFSAVASGVNLYGIAMRHTWGRDYTDLIGRKRSCVWVEEKGVFENLTTRTGIPLPSRLIAQKVLSARRLRGAYFRFLDPLPAVSMVGSWIGNALRRSPLPNPNSSAEQGERDS